MHKLGIIGYGGMASWHHSNITNQLKGVLEVAAVFDIDPERRKIAEEKGLRAFDNVEDFFASKLFDIVLVATPNNFHRDYVVAALEHGYNAISEKPVAMNTAELSDMIAASEKAGKLFSVHQNRRWDADYRVVCEAIRSGMVGKPYTIESCVHGAGGVVHGWRAYKVAGGGMLYDWGVHLIDQLMYFYADQKVTEVYCNTYSIRTPEVDDYFKLIMKFENGVSAQIEVGTYCLEQKPRWYVNGEEGSLIMRDWNCEGKVVHASQTAMDWEPEVIQTKAGPTRTMAPRPKETLEELPLPEPKDADWTNYYKNIIGVLDGKAELIVKPAQVMRVLRVIEAAFESAEKGIVVNPGV